ncbi:hypothetical protein Hypma_013945 [Hypsizygus marmoreus]|uniref:DUF6593 domain-containing protein n=1 Tax=Hypsizygus marmoreus TaxID=39966 RepID=A0A369K9I5_HYPMA|nr:hypothetical protein Hypma_013945 [Hypsizygus marmoreus]
MNVRQENQPHSSDMHLYLSSASPMNTVFRNEVGQALYRVRTPSRVFGRTTTISRIVPNNTSTRAEKCGRFEMHDVFGHLAQIEWKSFRSSRLRFQDREMKTRAFFRKQGFGCRGRNRVFVAPDGREYKWKLNSRPPELRTNDERQTLVARFHLWRHPYFSSPPTPSLEILPAGEHIADMILVSFIYIERLRQDE